MYKERLNLAINKYKLGTYNEKDFQDTLESIAFSVTESQLYQVREFLMDVGAELEYINFMVDSHRKHDKYLEQIDRIETYISSSIEC